MDDKEKLLNAFAQADIEGLDPAAALARFAGNPKLFLKVLKSFTDSIGAHLDRLNELEAQGAIADYAIEVHGVKGSCYGIGANREGDLAKELEFAAKANETDKVHGGNAPFVDEMRRLSDKLSSVLRSVESGDGAAGVGGAAALPEPDRQTLAAMLQASRDFDAEKMQELLRELESHTYASGGDLVAWLSEQVTAFAYDKIEERLGALL